MKSRYIIPNLTQEQKDRVRDLLDRDGFELAFETVSSELAAALGVRISRSTFARLKRILELEDELSNREGIKAAAHVLAHEESSADLKSASIALLREKAFQLATSTDRRDLHAAAHILQNLDRLDRATESSKASEPHTTPREQTEQFRLEIARHALLHHAEIGSIRGNKGLSEDRKQRMVMTRLFGNETRSSPS